MSYRSGHKRLWLFSVEPLISNQNHKQGTSRHIPKIVVFHRHRLKALARNKPVRQPSRHSRHLVRARKESEDRPEQKFYRNHVRRFGRKSRIHYFTPTRMELTLRSISILVVILVFVFQFALFLGFLGVAVFRLRGQSARIERREFMIMSLVFLIASVSALYKASLLTQDRPREAYLLQFVEWGIATPLIIYTLCELCQFEADITGTLML